MGSVYRRIALSLSCLLGALAASNAGAADTNKSQPGLSFVQFQSPNLQSATPLTIKGKLSFPSAASVVGRSKLPAVLILHGSSGVDARGDFYEAALNAAGFVTLQIDMWEARGVTGIGNRPQAPILTYPDAFSALAFLAANPRIDATRIGVIGFSWGGVVSLGAAERLYAGSFGGGRRFAAHVAHYPVCYGANNTSIPVLNPPSAVGTQFLNLTGSPVLIQIGSNDDYDNGAAACQQLAATVNPSNNNRVEVQTYPGAFHAFDRLMVPTTVPDPFANQGSYFSTGVVPLVRMAPSIDQAHQARSRAVSFFLMHL